MVARPSSLEAIGRIPLMLMNSWIWNAGEEAKGLDGGKRGDNGIRREKEVHPRKRKRGMRMNKKVRMQGD